jgi:hypothetical protein
MRRSCLVQGQGIAKTPLGRAILYKVSPAVLGRLLLILGACGASSGLVACSWLLDWNAYTDGGGPGTGGLNGGETGGGGAGGPIDSSMVPEDAGEWINVSFDASEASGGSDGALDADGSDGFTAADGAHAADSARDAVNGGSLSCMGMGPRCDQACRGCCDSMGCCHFGLYDTVCGNGGQQCQDCTMSGPSMSCVMGSCSNSQGNGPACTPTNVTMCGNRCIPFYQATCCKTDQTCGCTLAFVFPPPPCQ